MSTEAHELALYAVNNSALYRQRIEPIIKNLKRKMAKGSYRQDLALKLWKYAADDAAQRYAKEFGGVWHKLFSVADRKEAAAEIAGHYAEHLHENPRRKPSKYGRVTPWEASQMLSTLESDTGDFHALRSDDVNTLLDLAKEIGYRAPKGAKGSKARYFYAYLKNRSVMKVRENPRRKQLPGVRAYTQMVDRKQRALDKNRYQTVVAPYSLEAGSVGQPTEPEKIISAHSSKNAALKMLGSIISGKRRTVLPRGGFRVFVRDTKTGDEISRTGNVLKRNPTARIRRPAQTRYRGGFPGYIVTFIRPNAFRHKRQYIGGSKGRWTVVYKRNLAQVFSTSDKAKNVVRNNRKWFEANGIKQVTILRTNEDIRSFD